MWTRPAALTVLAALALCGSAWAQLHRRTEAAIQAESDRVVRQWQGELRAIDGLLVAGDADKAYKKVSRLLKEMTARIVSGPQVAELLSTALVLRALAAVERGERDEGIWHWQVAQQMFPQVADWALTAYGEAGRILKAHPARQPPETDSAEGAEAERSARESEVAAPQKLHAPLPKFPPAKRGIDAVAIELEVIIDERGRPQAPRILDSKGELTLVCSSFDALRVWEFEPARLDGKPVKVLYHMTVNFRSR